MENIRNKSTNLSKKKYFDRFTKLNVYSYTKPNDKKINLGCKPTEVYSLFQWQYKFNQEDFRQRTRLYTSR